LKSHDGRPKKAVKVSQFERQLRGSYVQKLSKVNDLSTEEKTQSATVFSEAYSRESESKTVALRGSYEWVPAPGPNIQMFIANLVKMSQIQILEDTPF
jgi:hypothetical protein